MQFKLCITQADSNGQSGVRLGNYRGHLNHPFGVIMCGEEELDVAAAKTDQKLAFVERSRRRPFHPPADIRRLLDEYKPDSVATCTGFCIYLRSVSDESSHTISR